MGRSAGLEAPEPFKPSFCNTQSNPKEQRRRAFCFLVVVSLG